jgi:hypothetical protein
MLSSLRFASQSRIFSLAAAFSALAAGCNGDDDGGGGADGECLTGAVECVSESLLHACVPGDSGSEWFVYQCGVGERCGMGTAPAVPAAGAGAAGMAPPVAAPAAACVGATCTAGQSECASTTLARHCVDGREWQLQPCEAGQTCEAGACRFNDGGVQACQPGARRCGSEKIEKVCDSDGSEGLEQDGEDGEQCLVDRCAPDPDASCDVGGRCLDNKTALRCLGEASGFEVVACEGETYCEDGRCRGSVCALGSLCADPNQVVECVDGESLRNVQCDVNEACKQTRDEAECVPKPCEPGVIRCGDPRDPDVDDTKFYSQCLPANATESGLPEWVVGECTGLLSCDAVAAALGEPCQQECTPGAQACVGYGPSGVVDGWAECDDDGEWGPVESCNPGGGARRTCVTKPTLDASALPVALCAEPVCAYVIENQDGKGGACTGGQLQACNEDGELEDPEDCEIGICRNTTAIAEEDGRVPARCDEEVECEEDEERCLFDVLLPTPLFQRCENGIWSANLRTCDDDQDCRGFVDDEGLRKKICGGQCAPGEKRCNIDDEVEACDDDGEWGNGESCDVGLCSTLGGAVGTRDAGCVLECVPGERRCTGATVVASDGVSTGFAQQTECDDDGLLGVAEDCDDDETCRVSSVGEHLGCVECVGADVIGGNEWGYEDTRCDPDALEDIQSCGDDNSWEDARGCDSDRVCHMVNGSSCGTCSINGVFMTCTETNVAMQQRCGPCSHANLGVSPIASCRNTTIVSLTSATTTDTCEDLFGDGPAATAVGGVDGTTTWGGVTDCCDGASPTGADGEFLIGHDCASRFFGTPVASGAPDCCSSYAIPGVGPAFAYCAIP